MSPLKFIKEMAGGRRVADTQKRAGVYVSRPVLNGQEWYDWAVKWGVPKPKAAADMHVTVIYSVTDVKMIPDQTVQSIYVGPGYGDAGAFCMFGPKADHLVLAFFNYSMDDRHWNFLRNGAVTTWPSFRPHMTISSEAAGFDLPDAALADAPLYISLGGEVFADLKADSDAADDDAFDEGEPAEDDDGALIVIIAAARQAALEIEAMKGATLNPLERTALHDVAQGRSISAAVARSLSKAEWATDAIKALAPAERAKRAGAQAQVAMKKSAEATLTVKQVSEEVAKKIGALAKGATVDEERRLVLGIASVSTIDGELIEDWEGDKITTRALEEFCHDLIRGGRAGTFEHSDDFRNEIVEALVFSEDLQKSLGIDLGMEFLLIRTHVPDNGDWAKVQKGTWMQSIRGLMYYEEVADG